MQFNYSDKNTPFVLSPESLDWYLSKGWYRMGATIFTTHFLYFKDKPYSAIWIRIDLQDFTFSKSQRKLMRRNAALFNTTVEPRVIDKERDELYKIYAEDFDGRLSPTISDSLEDYNGDTVFTTYEVTVREKISNRLVADSYFDLGDAAAASILGIYDPGLKSFSLGYYTMLLEMEYCLAKGIRYYYPGYVVPGYQRFDYKLRLGESHYFDVKTDKWLPYDQQEIEKSGPVESQLSFLSSLVESLVAKGANVALHTYPMFEAGFYDMWHEGYVPYPYIIPLGQDPDGHIIIVAFDPRDEEYRLLSCQHMVESQIMFTPVILAEPTQGKYFTDLLSIKAVLFRSSSTATMTRACTTLLNL